MRNDRRQRRALVCVLLLWPVLLAAAQDRIAEKLLSPAELATLDRDNDMWRLVRADEEVGANLKILGEAGFTADDLKRIEPKLTELWTVPFERHFGWLTAETVERIQEIDHNYTARMRAARLRAETGIQIMAPYQSTPRQVSAQWHWAILKALDYDEIAEFRLMNSPAARKIDVQMKDIALTESERRQLNEWQRDFDAVYGRGLMPGGQSQEGRRWRQEGQLDFFRRMRDLLGDARFESYLASTSPSFRRTRELLHDASEADTTATLDAWWIHQRYQVARTDEHRWREVDALAAAERTELTALLGDDAFARYAKNEDEATWLYPKPVMRTTVKPGKPGQANLPQLQTSSASPAPSPTPGNSP